ncbi:MAG: FeoB-associated Cys-rich membrane protein [Prevotellaceae bacterium]|nr:FeoB-associated Cys-rich membrane protein [Prevotellaceae bacterium]
MIQEIIVYLILLLVAGYIFRRIFWRKKERSCDSCSECSIKSECTKERKDKQSAGLNMNQRSALANNPQ